VYCSNDLVMISAAATVMTAKPYRHSVLNIQSPPRHRLHRSQQRNKRAFA
jgi:hypothetical protein